MILLVRGKEVASHLTMAAAARDYQTVAEVETEVLRFGEVGARDQSSKRLFRDRVQLRDCQKAG